MLLKLTESGSEVGKRAVGSDGAERYSVCQFSEKSILKYRRPDIEWHSRPPGPPVCHHRGRHRCRWIRSRQNNRPPQTYSHSSVPSPDSFGKEHANVPRREVKSGRYFPGSMNSGLDHIIPTKCICVGAVVTVAARQFIHGEVRLVQRNRLIPELLLSVGAGICLKCSDL